MAFDLKKWILEKRKQGEVLFDITGEITEKRIIDTLGVIDKITENISNKTRKKIYNILVECMQNLFHHSKDLPCKSGINISGKYAMCFLLEGKQQFHIVAGNFIGLKQKEFLDKHLSNINSLNNTGLKDLYKTILNNQEFSDKGGGGLGMVDMCRKSGNKLDFDFYEYVDDYYFYSLQININK